MVKELNYHQNSPSKHTVFTRLLDYMSPLNIPWYNHLVAMHVSIDPMTKEHGLENCFVHTWGNRHIHDSHCKYSAIWKELGGGNALIWHLSTCRSLFIANIKRDRKCNMYSNNRAVLKFKDNEICGYRVWILF